MIVVDTTVWADWFKGTDSPAVGRLNLALERQDVGLVPAILTEVLQGFRADGDFERARSLLVQLPVLALDVEGTSRRRACSVGFGAEASPCAARLTGSLPRHASRPAWNC